MRFTKTKAQLPNNEKFVGADAPSGAAIKDRKKEVANLLKITPHGRKEKN